MCLVAHSTLTYNPGHWTFRRAPAAPVSRMGREEMLPLRGQFLELQLQTRPLEAREAANEAALKRRSQIGDGKQI